MTPEQWQKVRLILESALELDPSRRPDFLNGACADIALRREVESLLASHEQAGTNALKPGSVLELNPEDEARFRLQLTIRYTAVSYAHSTGTILSPRSPVRLRRPSAANPGKNKQ